MPQWKFNEHRPGDVEVEITQRDQFKDDVELAEALVREVVQNSLDAAAGVEPVRVRFSLATLDDARAGDVTTHLAGLRHHLAACREKCVVNPSRLDGRKVRVLVVEDFGTTGLTGRYDTLDDGNFRNFWRRHGRSSKGGAKGGRWGLGKLVFSLASDVRAFFGLTLREGDGSPLLMGQAVLAYHELDGRNFVPHGFWFDREEPDGLQLPVTDPDSIRRFSGAAGITRKHETGFSVVVPHVLEGLDEAALIRGVVNHCYFPILSGRLVVETGSGIINRDTFLQFARKVESGGALNVPFHFVAEISRGLRSAPGFQAREAIGRKALTGESFAPEELSRIREQYSRGELVHVRVPVVLQPKSGDSICSAIEVFLRRLREGEKSFALYARGPITLPGERRYFHGAPALGAVIAREGEMVSELLGDAENPAHTHWVAGAERLQLGWMGPQDVVKNIRYSLRNLFDLIAEESREIDETSLAAFFPAPKPVGTDTPTGPGTTTPHPEPPRRERTFEIRKREGGFEIVPGPGAKKWKLPRRLRVRVAYDMIGANPFLRHSRFDFDLREREISVKGEGVEVSRPKEKANVLVVEITEPDFRLRVEGFDANRDLVVDAREAG